MVDKTPNCLYPNENPEEILTILPKSQNDYYNELLNPFTIQDQLSPNLTKPQISLQNPSSSKDLTQKNFPVFSHTISDLNILPIKFSKAQALTTQISHHF